MTMQEETVDVIESDSSICQQRLLSHLLVDVLVWKALKGDRHDLDNDLDNDGNHHLQSNILL